MHDIITTRIYLTPAIASQIRAHGTETYPHECCGALLGRELAAHREVVALFPLINRRDDSPRNRFSVTSDDVRAAEKAAQDAGCDVIGWYHSHPDHPARPSEFDREHAWPWYSYIIVSVAERMPKAMNSWRLADDRTHFTAEEIEVKLQASA